MTTSTTLFCLAIGTLFFLQRSTGQILPENSRSNDQVIIGANNLNLVTSEGSIRIPRQSGTNSTTIPKPKKHRPANIFNLISVLLKETKQDAREAINEIGTLFNSQFSNSTQNSTTETTTATSPASVDGSHHPQQPHQANKTETMKEEEDEEEDDEDSEPFMVTREQFLGILRSNVQGIANLFGRELRVAIQDSNKNVKAFQRDFKNAIRPYFT